MAVQGGAVSYERGTTVDLAACAEARRSLRCDSRNMPRVLWFSYGGLAVSYERGTRCGAALAAVRQSTLRAQVRRECGC